MKNVQRLLGLYKLTSKHSNYQILPSAFIGVIDNSQIQVNSRFEEERMLFITQKVELENKKVLDIGGNTGFFSFEALAKGASTVDYIEGNKAHADFVREAAFVLNKNITVQNEYVDFSESLRGKRYDVVFLLNVLHHFGDDYGDKNTTVEFAKHKIIESINYLKDKTEYIVLQIGFCWKGDVTKLLFANGTKSEMIDFFTTELRSDWLIQDVGIAEEHMSRTQYYDVSEKNIIRDDTMGEFRNRPIFILRSLSYTKLKV